MRLQRSRNGRMPSPGLCRPVPVGPLLDLSLNRGLPSQRRTSRTSSGSAPSAPPASSPRSIETRRKKPKRRWHRLIHPAKSTLTHSQPSHRQRAVLERREEALATPLAASLPPPSRTPSSPVPLTPLVTLPKACRFSNAAAL